MHKKKQDALDRYRSEKNVNWNATSFKLTEVSTNGMLKVVPRSANRGVCAGGGGVAQDGRVGAVISGNVSRSPPIPKFNKSLLQFAIFPNFPSIEPKSRNNVWSRNAKDSVARQSRRMNAADFRMRVTLPPFGPRNAYLIKWKTVETSPGSKLLMRPYQIRESFPG